MVDGKILVEKLLKYAEKFLHLNARDEIYFRNLLLREFKLDEPAENAGDLSFIDTLDVPDIIVSELEEFAVEKGFAIKGLENLYSTYIFGLLSPLPSTVNQTFLKIKEEQGIEKACEYFYDLSVKNNYVQKTAIGKNLKWEYVDGDKYLEITVNLSKPEKDNKEIAKLLSDCEVLITAESKGLQLTHVVARELDMPYYAVCRKSKKLYMQDGIDVLIESSITTGCEQHLYLSKHDVDLIKGKKVGIVDDVVSTGASLQGIEDIVKKAGGIIHKKAFVLAEGDAANRKDVIYLATIPIL